MLLCLEQVDPSKLADKDDIDSNRRNLTAVADRLIERVAASAPKAAVLVRELAHRLQVRPLSSQFVSDNIVFHCFHKILGHNSDIWFGL